MMGGFEYHVRKSRFYLLSNEEFDESCIFRKSRYF